MVCRVQRTYKKEAMRYSNYTPITVEEFTSIYSDKQMRNAVAYAHPAKFSDYNDEEETLVAIYGTRRLLVTEEQKDEALRILNRDKKRMLKKHMNDLLFCGMGIGGYQPTIEDEICNYRIRTEFLNSEGKRYFVEFSTDSKRKLIVMHDIDRDMEEAHFAELRRIRESLDQLKKIGDRRYWDEVNRYHKTSMGDRSNWQKLNSGCTDIDYTHKNVLELINNTYGCSFKRIVVDQDTLHPNDAAILCYSPKSNSLKQNEISDYKP